jgi:cell wall-associated NlpC family hydrolase
MPTSAQIQYIQQRAQALGLDPRAVLAIAGHEGLSGGIGDGGHAFGPWQMNNAGGVLTGKFAGQTPQQINQWAWSNQGIDSALGQIAGVARGLKGSQAIQAITTRFERPANPGAEIADANARYGKTPGVTLTSPGLGRNVLTQPGGGNVISAGGGPQRQALLQQVMGGRVDFNSNQVQTPNLLAISQLRQMNSTGATGSIPHVSTAVAAAAVTGGSATGQAIAKTALSQLGQPYQYGGLAKLGHPTDCSGLLQAAAAAHGVNISRTTYTQWKEGRAVPTNALQAGDAVFFKGSDSKGNLPGHVGIYIGGGKFVEDPHTGATVTISTLAGRSDYVGARRFV